METQTESQAQAAGLWQRSTTRRLLVWLFCKRTLCRVAFGVAALATLVGLFYGIENWRGKRAWNKYKQQLEAQGQHLDWAAVVPPAIPDEKNFAATRFLRLIAMHPRDAGAEVEKYWPKDFNNASDQFNRVNADRKKKKTVGPERKLTDLAAWQAAFVKAKSKEIIPLPEEMDMDPAARAKAATAVLEHLVVYEPVLEEMRQASTRPECRFNIGYEIDNPCNILLPHLSRMKGICKLLQVRAAAELALGQTEKAYQDVRLMLRLAEGLEGEPILISYLVQIASFRIATDTIWEGMDQHQWTDSQLQQLQAQLQRFDFLAGLGKSFQAERSWGIKFIEYLRKSSNFGEALSTVGSDENSDQFMKDVSEPLLNLVPSGWLYWEEYNYAQSFPMPTNVLQTRRIEVVRCLQKDQEMEKLLKGPHPFRTVFLHHRFLSRLLLPALAKAQFRAAEGQTVADEAVAACALERYRLANGKFPEQLQALVPKFLEKVPQDVISGSPLIYHLTADGQYVLYSVGLNEKDDGGLVSLKQSPTDAHDWVWRSQPKQ